MIKEIIKDLEKTLNISIAEKDITYYTDGATESIVFNIKDKYLIKTVDDITFKTQTEFLNYYKEVPEFQTIIHQNEELKYICFEFKEGSLFRKNKITANEAIEQIYSIVNNYKEYNHEYYGYLYEDEKTWYEFLKDEVEYSNNKMIEANINLDKVNKALEIIKEYDSPKYLIHGDFGVHNFIVNNKHIHVIDPMSVVGDYLYDFYFSIYSDTDLFTNLDISEILKYFDRDQTIKKALLTITFFIRMSRAYVYDKPYFHLYTKYYDEVIS
jgi:hypothetical protein